MRVQHTVGVTRPDRPGWKIAPYWAGGASRRTATPATEPSRLAETATECAEYTDPSCMHARMRAKGRWIRWFVA